MQIVVKFLIDSLDVFTAFAYFSEKIIPSASDLSIKLIISLSGKDLSSGTTVNPAVVIAK